MLESQKKKAIHRLSKIRGQIEGIINMIEKEKYPLNIVTQLLALQGGIRAASLYILENHFYTIDKDHQLDRQTRKLHDRFIKEAIKACHLSGR